MVTESNQSNALSFDIQPYGALKVSCFCCCRISTPEVCSFFNPERWIYGRSELFFPLFSDFSGNAISNTLYVLIVSSTCLNSLSNGANNSLMFHQKSVLNKEKLKTRFQSKTQLSHNGLPKLAILQDKLDL